MTSEPRVFMRGVSWGTYESLLTDRGERAFPRVVYLDGELELMSPSGNHDQISRMLAMLCIQYCFLRGIDVRALGSWTIRRREQQAGAEPDECFVFGRHEAERPDLAIEVAWTRGGIEKLEIYRRLGVPEVWIWHRRRISVFVLEDGHYRKRERSRFMPEFDLQLACELAQLETFNEALARWQQALQQ